MATVAADQGTKRLAERLLTPHEYAPIIGQLVGWYLLRNSQARGPATLVLPALLIVLAIVAFLGVWGWDWGYVPAVAALGVLLGGVLTTFFSKYWLGTDLQFLIIRPIPHFGINVAVLASLGGGLVLVLMGLTGRFPRHHI